MYSSSHYLTIFKDVAVQNLTRTQCLKALEKGFESPQSSSHFSLQDIVVLFYC